MIILNDKRFSDEIFCEVSNKEDIEKTSNNSTLIFSFREDLLDTFKFCKENGVNYAVKVCSVVEAIFSMNLGAKYIFVSNLELAKKIQKIATEYLSDSKIILFVGSYDEDMIEITASNYIDGIFL